MTLALRYAALTNDGLVREHNEDSGYAGPNLLAVADGMGGMVYGELASGLTIDSLRRLDSPHHDDLLAALHRAAKEANERVAERISAEPRLEGMGTTLTAVLFDGTRFGFAHIGDSRGYLLREGSLQQFTVDHTFVQSLVDDGRLSKEEARTHPHKNLITRAVQGQPETEPDLAFIELQPGDRVLLCSDGLTDPVDDQSIADTLRRHAAPDAAASELVDLALQGGGPDNVTCVIGDVVDESEQTGPVPPTAAVAGTPYVLVGAAADMDPAQLEAPAETTAPQPVVEAAETVTPPPPPPTDEEQRYAPLPPKRFRWLRRTAVGVLVLAVIAAAGWGVYTWTQSQYYVGPYPDGADPDTTAGGAGGSGGAGTDEVAIYRGVPQSMPLIDLHSVVDRQPLKQDDLPEYWRKQLSDTINAEDRSDAEQTVAELRQMAAKCAEARKPKPEPTPTPDPSPGQGGKPGDGPSPGDTEGTGGAGNDTEENPTRPSSTGAGAGAAIAPPAATEDDGERPSECDTSEATR